MSLLKTAEITKSKTALKKIIEMMNFHNFQITAEIYDFIIDSCITNSFPITLHEIMTKFINEGKLPKESFIKYSLYIDNFREYCKEIRDISVNIQDYLKIPLNFSIIEPIVVRLITLVKKKDLSDFLNKFRKNVAKNLDLPGMSNLTDEEKMIYQDDIIFQANYKACMYLLCCISNDDFKKEVINNYNI